MGPRLVRLAVKGVLTEGADPLRIIEGHRLRREDAPLEFPDELSAHTFLRRFLRDPFSLAVLRNHLLEVVWESNLWRLDEHAMIREFARHLVSGRIRIVPALEGVAPTRSSIPHKAAGENQQEKREERQEERPAKRPVVFPEASRPVETHNWIKLKVVDDETGEPLPGVPVKIKLPSGEVGTPKTDWKGVIEVYELPPGTLDILEMLDEEAFEVVGID